MRTLAITMIVCLAALGTFADNTDQEGRRRGLAAHYFSDPINWAGHWPDTVSVPKVDPNDWTFSNYAYSRIEPLVNHRFVKEGWFTVRWTGLFDPTKVDKDDGNIDFDINDQQVIPTRAYKTDITILGSALTLEGDNLPVTVRIRVGDTTYEPWGQYIDAEHANVNDNANPRTFLVPGTTEEKTPITVKACSWTKTSRFRIRRRSQWKELLEVGSDSQSANLVVLRDGDDVPGAPGMSGQDPAVHFVRDYIENGKMRLGAHQAIFLFELGTTKLRSGAADFQDLVVLVSLIEMPSATPEEPESFTEGHEYFFSVLADDGCRLFIDGKPLIDDWRPCWEKAPDALRKAKPITLGPGKHSITIEYFQGQSLKNHDSDPIKFFWFCPTRHIPKQIVPASCFTHLPEHLASSDRN